MAVRGKNKASVTTAEGAMGAIGEDLEGHSQEFGTFQVGLAYHKFKWKGRVESHKFQRDLHVNSTHDRRTGSQKCGCEGGYRRRMRSKPWVGHTTFIGMGGATGRGPWKRAARGVGGRPGLSNQVKKGLAKGGLSAEPRLLKARARSELRMDW